MRRGAGEGTGLREDTREDIAKIMRYLRGGKAPKEIAFILNRPYDTIRKLILRSEQARSVYAETYTLRHPDKPAVPPRFKIAL